MAEQDDFIKQQQAAVERMREMSSRAIQGSSHTMPPAPPFISLQGGEARKNISVPTAPPEAALPNSGSAAVAEKSAKGILDKIKTEPELPLLLVLLLLLWSEKADRRLMLALAYIML